MAWHQHGVNGALMAAHHGTMISSWLKENVAGIKRHHNSESSENNSGAGENQANSVINNNESIGAISARQRMASNEMAA
jgi:hypothetical protein